MKWSRGRLACFTAGTLLTLVALAGPLHDLQFELLTAHLLQNVVLAEWAPALLVLGLPPELGRRLARYVPPWLGLPLWLLVYYAWHAPPLYDAALRHPDSLLQAEHVSYLIAGAALWLPLFHGTMSNGAKAGYVFAAFLLISPLGLMLALDPGQRLLVLRRPLGADGARGPADRRRHDVLRGGGRLLRRARVLLLPSRARE